MNLRLNEEGNNEIGRLHVWEWLSSQEKSVWSNLDKKIEVQQITMVNHSVTVIYILASPFLHIPKYPHWTQTILTFYKSMKPGRSVTLITQIVRRGNHEVVKKKLSKKRKRSKLYLDNLYSQGKLVPGKVSLKRIYLMYRWVCHINSGRFLKCYLKTEGKIMKSFIFFYVIFYLILILFLYFINIWMVVS